MSNNTLLKAKEYAACGLSVIPIRADGSKAPAVKWERYQLERPDTALIDTWFPDAEERGIGIVCGPVSGGVEVIDFDAAELFKPWCLKVAEAGQKSLLQRLVIGKTPKGFHVYYRCVGVADGNRKLASRQISSGQVETLIETRGKGGYVIAPGGSILCHPSKLPYQTYRGKAEDIPTISPEQRELLLDLAASFNEVFKESSAPPDHQSNTQANLPGRDFEERGDWTNDVLLPAGYRLLKKARDGETYWVRPGSNSTAPHLTLNYRGSNRLHVFSTNCHPLIAGESYSKFGAHAMLFHNGSFSEASKALKAKGFGKPGTKSKAVQGEGIAPELEDDEERPFEWEPPILFGKIETSPIPFDVLPEVLANYAEAVAASTQTPPGLVVMLILSAVAACVQRRACIRAKKDGGYSEPLNLWTLTALPPGSRKTKVLQHVMQPIWDWEAAQARKLKSTLAGDANKRKVYQKRIEILQNRAANEADEKAQMKLFEEIKELEEKLPAETRAPQLCTGDTTAEALQNLLVDQGERMSVISDEGVIFEVMSGLYSGGKINLDVFLQAHAGSPTRVNRQKRSCDLVRPALTFGLAVQPDVTSDLASGDKKKFRGRGVPARFLFCVPRSNIGKRDLRRATEIDQNLAVAYSNLIWTLLQGWNSPSDKLPDFIHLSDEAHELWITFAQEVEDNQGEEGDYYAIQDWTAKLPGAVLRIAGGCHLAEHGLQAAEVDSTTIERAIRLGRLLITHAQCAFDLMGNDPGIEDAKHVLRWILKNGKGTFRQNDVHRTGRFSKDKIDRLKRAFTVLQDRHIISELKQENARKPILYYEVNPEVLGRAETKGNSPTNEQTDEEAGNNE